MSQADGYIEIATQTEVVEQGTLVEVTLFRGCGRDATAGA
jgi:hypothetical protein